ncbi:unnamed protein product [Somion occarium]|uniref:Peptidase C14 caspase domain-containing protein n=1 Tax=Somion occarium TaxID=3059160 RepID=A0ABP1CV51_9APHY
MRARPSPIRTPVRRALCIAVRYEHLRGLGLELETTHYDPLKISKLLTEIYGWKDDDITILMDDPLGEYLLPTRANIMQAMEDLVKDAQFGDEFVFHFSGHGSQIRNEDGTEKDGFDEVILPLDVEVDPKDAELRNTKNFIIDDDIRDILVDSLPAGARLIMIFDSCHSGTAADLPVSNGDWYPRSPVVTSPIGSPVGLTVKNKILTKRGAEEPQIFSPISPFWSKELELSSASQPYVTSWSACKDDQLTYEWEGGLFVEAFTRVLRKNPHPTHSDLLRALGKELDTYSAWFSSDSDSDASTPRPQIGALCPFDQYSNEEFYL